MIFVLCTVRSTYHIGYLTHAIGREASKHLPAFLVFAVFMTRCAVSPTLDYAFIDDSCENGTSVSCVAAINHVEH